MCSQEIINDALRNDKAFKFRIFGQRNKKCVKKLQDKYIYILWLISEESSLNFGSKGVVKFVYVNFQSWIS